MPKPPLPDSSHIRLAASAIKKITFSYFASKGNLKRKCADLISSL
jgi:hypothetical protein